MFLQKKKVINLHFETDQDTTQKKNLIEVELKNYQKLQS